MASGRHLGEVLGDRIDTAVFSEESYLSEAGVAVDHFTADITPDWLRNHPKW
jgi:hypothetical protein